jgi:hypothetical protein
MANLKAMALAKIVRPPRRLIVESNEEEENTLNSGINEERDVEPTMNERKINITANVPRLQVQKNLSGLEISMESTANSKKNGMLSVMKTINKPPIVPNKSTEGIKFLE